MLNEHNNTHSISVDHKVMALATWNCRVDHFGKQRRFSSIISIEEVRSVVWDSRFPAKISVNQLMSPQATALFLHQRQLGDFIIKRLQESVQRTWLVAKSPILSNSAPTIFSNSLTANNLVLIYKHIENQILDSFTCSILW